MAKGFRLLHRIPGHPCLEPWRKGKRKFHIPGRWHDYPQCPVWSQCFPADPRLEQEGGCFRRNRLFAEHRWSLAGDSCFVNGWPICPVISLWGITILLLLIAISTISFALYNKLLSCNPVGKVAIYNSLIPVVGAITSCLCLGETFYWKYLIAGALATAGIYIINKGKK